MATNNNPAKEATMTRTTTEALASASALLEKVHKLEEIRHNLRLNGGLLGELDGRLAAARTHACGALLGASKAFRDAGDHEKARELAAAYAEQEHLALRARDHR